MYFSGNLSLRVTIKSDMKIGLCGKLSKKKNSKKGILLVRLYCVLYLIAIAGQSSRLYDKYKNKFCMETPLPI